MDTDHLYSRHIDYILLSANNVHGSIEPYSTDDVNTHCNIRRNIDSFVTAMLVTDIQVIVD